MNTAANDLSSERLRTAMEIKFDAKNVSLKQRFKLEAVVNMYQTELSTHYTLFLPSV